jgi:hypothetical protein
MLALGSKIQIQEYIPYYQPKSLYGRERVSPMQTNVPH